MVRTQSNSITRMYDELAKSGHKSNLRLTVKVLDGSQERFYYDIGIRAIDDPQNILSDRIEVGTIDKGKNIPDGHGGSMWIKKFKPIYQPRFLEDFIAKYGKKYIKIHESGKYIAHADLVKKLLA